MRPPTLLVLALLLAGCTEPPGSGMAFDPAKGTAFGTLVAATQEGERWNVTLDARAVNCERNATRWTGLVRAPTMPAPGEEVGVRADDGSNVAGQWANLTAYAENCAPVHAGDVKLIGIETPPGIPAQGTTVRARGVPVVLGAATRVRVMLETPQDQPVEARFTDMAVRESAFPRGGREQCRVEPPNLTLAVTPGVGHVLPLTVACPADAPFNATRLSGIYGRLAFTDELGAEHERDGALWQFVAVGRAATLYAEAPASLKRGDEVLVRARYVDADGAPIRGAQVTAWLEWPDAKLPLFSLRQEADGSYALRQADLAEHAPASWPPGERAIVVEAEDPVGGHVWCAARVMVRYA